MYNLFLCLRYRRTFLFICGSTLLQRKSFSRNFSLCWVIPIESLFSLHYIYEYVLSKYYYYYYSQKYTWILDTSLSLSRLFCLYVVNNQYRTWNLKNNVHVASNKIKIYNKKRFKNFWLLIKDNRLNRCRSYYWKKNDDLQTDLGATISFYLKLFIFVLFHFRLSRITNGTQNHTANGM